MNNEKNYKKVKCNECNAELYKITNTHLWNIHQMTHDEYSEKYPTALFEDPQLASDRQLHKRDKSYEDIYGNEKGILLRNTRVNSAIKQFTDIKQREYRSIKYRKEKQGVKGNKYVNLGKQLYGNECERCGITKKIIVHHIDGDRENNNAKNLMVLCQKCHIKLHNIVRASSFRGIGLVEKGMIYILKGLQQEFGLNIKNENFKGTPKRVARAYYEIFSGINSEEELHNIAETSFPSEYDGMVIAKDIECFSMCPHHFLPVEYIVNVGYIPNKKTVGISKLSRIVELLAKQPELQEMYTKKISNLLQKELNPKGIIVQVKGRHMCMAMRGIKQRDSWTLTSSIEGVFKTDLATREEFALMIKN